MRYWCVSLVLGAAVFAQSTTRTSTTSGVDVNGRPVEGPSYASAEGKGYSSRTEYGTNPNGGRTPRESVEERVVSKVGDTVVIERIVRRYDANGNSTPAETSRIEETRRADGSGTRNVSTFRADINGNMQLAEQAVTDTKVSGNTTNTSVTVQRPTLNGGVEVVERQAEVLRKTAPNATQEENLVYRRDQNGQFVPIAREVRERVEKNGQVVENTSTYDNHSGALSLVGQSVAKTVTAPDGAQTTVTDVYTTAIPGRTADSYSGQVSLREQQVTEKRKNPDGSVVESTVSRRTNPRDPNRFESSQTIREVVCKGDCTPKP